MKYGIEFEFFVSKDNKIIPAYLATNNLDGNPFLGEIRTKPFDYEALILCLRKINHIFKGKHIGLPGSIGAGLAGGIWDKNDLPLKMLEALHRNFKDVKTIIQEELKDMNVTIVHYKK